MNDACSSKSMAPSRLLLIGGMILAAALFRLVPHPYNFTPIGAMALFGGAAIADRRLAVLFPLVAMFLSDVFIEFDASRLWVYGAIVLITLLGRVLQNHRRNVWWVTGGTLAASVLFFVVTNLGVWWMSGWYTHTFGELVRCFVAGIPFFGNTVAGDLVFSSVLFGGLALIESRQTAATASAVES